MSILLTTLPLVPRSVKLSFLLKNIVNHTLQSLNDHLCITNKEEICHFLNNTSKVFKMLAYIDVLKYYKSKRKRIIVADEIANLFEEMKMLFCAKCDLRSALYIHFYGYESCVSNSLLNLLSDKCNIDDTKTPESLPSEEITDIDALVKATGSDVDFDSINILIKIYLIKNDTSIYTHVQIENGILVLTYKDVVFKLTLCGNYTSPTWMVVSPPDLNIPFNLLPVYIKKLEIIRLQQSIFKKYSQIATGTFYDFEIQIFDNITLKIKNGTGYMKAFDERVDAQLDIEQYVKWIERWFIAEITKRYQHLKITYDLWFVIGEGLHFVEKLDTDKDFDIKMARHYIFAHKEQDVKDGSVVFTDDDIDYVVFASMRDFRTYFTHHQNYPFYRTLQILAKRNGMNYATNYQKKEFGDCNVMFVRDNNFVCVRCDDCIHRIFVGQSTKYKIMYFAELKMMKKQEKNNTNSDDKGESHPKNNTENFNSKKMYYLTNSLGNYEEIELKHIRHFLKDVSLLMMIGDILYLQDVSVTFDHEIKFVYHLDMCKFNIGIQSYTENTSNDNINTSNREFNDLCNINQQPKPFIARIIDENSNCEELIMYKMSNLVDFLTLMVIRHKLSHHGIQNDIEKVENKYLVTFVFYNLNIKIIHDQKLYVQCTNTLLMDILQNSISTDLISRLQALKLILKENLIPISSNKHFLLFKYNKIVVFKYFNEHYYCAVDGGYRMVDEKITSKMKNMEIAYKMTKIRNYMRAYEIMDTAFQMSNDENICMKPLCFVTEIGEFKIFRQQKCIILKFENSKFTHLETNILEKLFFNVFNFEHHFARYMDVLVIYEKAMAVIRNLNSS